MENKRTINIIMVSGILLLLIILFFDVKCIFKETFDIPCISCGLTRGFKSILKLDLIVATRCNVLSIPLFVIILLFYILYFISIIFNKNYIYNYYNFFISHYKLFLIIIFIGWLVNIVVYFHI